MNASRQVGDTSVDAGRGPGQLGWYRYAASLVANRSVLDVGCGLGKGLDILRTYAREARGQDLDPRLARPDVVIGPVADIIDKSVDFVVSIDVIEHIEDDSMFLRELSRIAREGIFLTTPLLVRGRDIWPYHVREYKFTEFVDLTRRYGQCTYYKGNPEGTEIYPIRFEAGFRKLHDMINNPWTGLLTRAASKLVPRSYRNHAHQAVLIVPE